MHPVENIRGSLSRHLEGKTVVLAVTGSIAAVKAVELARELVRHGARVVPVMSDAATRILHPDALEFATGEKPIVRLTGAVEHVALLGRVKGRADLLLVAPATANTIAKMALGIDDGPVTTCATVALGSGVPILVAPAMHEVMLEHPVIARHRAELERLGVSFVEPLREEGKAKLADVEAIAEEAIHAVATKGSGLGLLAGQRTLVVSGSTAEPLDPVRVITNRSSGRTGILLAQELHRRGADVLLWQGHGTVAVPSHLEACATEFDTVEDLLSFVEATDLSGFDQVWMPAAIGDYAPEPAAGKIASGQASLTVRMRPLPKVIAAIRKAAPRAKLVAFKAETDPTALVRQARDRLTRHDADAVVANLAASFGAQSTEVHFVTRTGVRKLAGPKAEVVPQLVRLVAALPARARAKGRR